MEQLNIIGLDLAKNVFQAHGMRADGSVAFRKKIARVKLQSFFASPLQLTLIFKELSLAWMASTIAGGTAKPFSIAGWFPISTRTPAVEEAPNEAASHSSTLPFSKSDSIP